MNLRFNSKIVLCGIDILIFKFILLLTRYTCRKRSTTAQQGHNRTSDGSNSNEEDDTNPFHNSSSSNDSTKRRARRNTRAYQAKVLEIKVDIPEFEGRLQPDDFID